MMRHTGRNLFLLLSGGILTACVDVHVEPLTQQPLTVRDGSKEVEVLDVEPTRPHINLARIIAMSESASEERLRDKIVASARKVGADAVVLGKVDVLHSMGRPTYQSTLGPASASFSPYSWGGWWDPFYLDPWSYVQGATDQTQWTLYLSGVAIRYGKVEAPGQSSSPK